MSYKTLTLGNYYPADSVVHSLDPRLKIVLMSILMVLTFLITSPLGVITHSCILIAAVALSTIPVSAFLRSLKLFIWLFIFTAVLHLLFTPGTPITGSPVFGVINITREGLVRGGLVSWRLLTVIALSALFTQTTTPLQITRGMEKLISPLARLRFPVQDFSLMMMIAIRFIPVLTEEAQRIWMAQRSRGANIKRGTLRKRAETLMSILLPVFTSVFRRADEMALALEARGYVPGKPRTSMKELRLTAADGFASLAILVWIASLLFLEMGL